MGGSFWWIYLLYWLYIPPRLHKVLQHLLTCCLALWIDISCFGFSFTNIISSSCSRNLWQTHCTLYLPNTKQQIAEVSKQLLVLLVAIFSRLFFFSGVCGDQNRPQRDSTLVLQMPGHLKNFNLVHHTKFVLQLTLLSQICQ